MGGGSGLFFGVWEEVKWRKKKWPGKFTTDTRKHGLLFLEKEALFLCREFFCTNINRYSACDGRHFEMAALLESAVTFAYNRHVSVLFHVLVYMFTEQRNRKSQIFHPSTNRTSLPSITKSSKK